MHFQTKLFFKGLFILFIASITGSSQTFARVKCDLASSECEFKTMPLNSQNSTVSGRDLSPWFKNPKDPLSSMLCGPTSTSMLLQAVINESKQTSQIIGWTKSSFKGQTYPKQIYNVMMLTRQPDPLLTDAQELKNLIYGGTGFSLKDSSIGYPRGLSGRSIGKDFANSGGFASTSRLYYGTKQIISDIRTNKAAIGIHIGYYKRILNSKPNPARPGKLLWFYTYKRSGGHYLAVQGFKNSNPPEFTRGTITIFNPWFGIEEPRTIKALTATTDCNSTSEKEFETNCQHLPSNKTQAQLFTINGWYHLIEEHSYVWAD